MCILSTLLLLSSFLTRANAQFHKVVSLRGHEQVLRKLQAPSVSMYLIDADTNLELGIIQNEEEFSLPTTVKNVNIEARSSASLKPGDRIQFGWNLIPIFRTEIKAPYAFCGDIAGKLNPCSELVINNTPIEVSATVLIGGENVASSTVIFTMHYNMAFTSVSPPTTFPTTAPSEPPVSSHTIFPTTTPSEPPVSLPPQVCGVPKLTGEWKIPHGHFPITVVESHGGIIGNDYCIVSGFFNGINATTPNIYCIDTQNTNADWAKRVSLKDSDSIENTPLGIGLSHGAETVVESRFYVCGGFLGANPGQAIKDCWYYDHSSNAIHAITSIPHPRGGGALMYSLQRNALIFTAGAVRPNVGKSTSIDYFNTWTYDLAQGDLGVWVSQDDIPFSGNHIMYTRAYDDRGIERFFVMGGQKGEDERNGNSDLMYEFVPSKPKATNQQWIQRASMALKRGHASSSTRAYGCGLIMVAGTTNQPTGKIDSIDYYDIPTDSWHQIGHLGSFVNTAVCVIYEDALGQDWVWCTSPYGLYRRQMIST